MPFKKERLANPLKLNSTSTTKNGSRQNFMSPSPLASPSTSPSPPNSAKCNTSHTSNYSSLDHFLDESAKSMPIVENDFSLARSRLHALFNQIEREFDAVLVENKRLIRLNQKLQELNSMSSDETPSYSNTNSLDQNNSKFNTLSSTSTLVPDNPVVFSLNESNSKHETKTNEPGSLTTSASIPFNLANANTCGIQAKNSKLTSSLRASTQQTKSSLITSKTRINNLSFPKFKPNAREFIMQSIKNTSAQIVNKTHSNNSVIQSKLQSTLTGHTDGIWDISIQPVPNHLITSADFRYTHSNTSLLVGTASADTTARLWYLNSLQNNSLSPSVQTHLQLVTSGFCVQQYCGHTGSVNSIRFHPKFFTEATNLILTASGDSQAHVWQSVLSPVHDSLESTSDVVLNYSSCYSIARQLANSSSLMSPNMATIRSPIRRFEGHSDTLIAAEWFPDGELLCTGSWDRTANVYNVETGKILCNLQHDDNLTNVNIHRTNKIILTSSKDCTFKVWDFRDPICSVNVYQGHTRSVNSAIFVNEDKLATSSDDQTLKLWDLRIMRSPLFTINANSGVNRICTMNGPISSQDMLSETVLCLPLDNRDIKIYNLNGERVHRLPRNNRIGHKRLVTSLASYGQLMLSCSFDKIINCWSLDYNSVKMSRKETSLLNKENDQFVSDLANLVVSPPSSQTNQIGAFSSQNGSSPVSISTKSTSLNGQSNNLNQIQSGTHASNLTTNSLKGINALSKFIKI